LKLILQVLGTPDDFSWVKSESAKGWLEKYRSCEGKDLFQLCSKSDPSSNISLFCILEKILLRIFPFIFYSFLYSLQKILQWFNFFQSLQFSFLDTGQCFDLAIAKQKQIVPHPFFDYFKTIRVILLFF
jgi:hypothetical protein